MTKDEFNKRLYSEFPLEEMIFININIYFNPKYVSYYTDYHCGEYERCLEFLKQHRHLLNIEHTPKKYMWYAKSQMSMLG